MRNIKIVGLVLIAAIMLSGCGVRADVTINAVDQTVESTSYTLLSEEEIGSMSTSIDNYTKEGDWYVSEPDITTTSWDKAEGMIVTEDYMAYNLPDMMSYYNFTFHMPSTVLSTNGMLSKDGKTITFETNKDGITLCNQYVYAIMSEDAFKSYDVIVKDSNEKSYKDGAVFKKKMKLKTSAGAKIKECSVTTQDGSNTVVTENKTFSIKVEGVNVVDVIFADGMCIEKTFYLDLTKPTIIVKDNKVTAKDKKSNGYASGIKSITVDGKKVKSGTKLKKGQHTIVAIDKAGNKRTKVVDI